MYNSQILANPGPRGNRGNKQRRERKKRRRHNRNELRRRSRLQENWLEEADNTSTAPADGAKSHENEVFSRQAATPPAGTDENTKDATVRTTTRRRPRNNNATS